LPEFILVVAELPKLTIDGLIPAISVALFS
jgi:hypothetical protein